MAARKKNAHQRGFRRTVHRRTRLKLLGSAALLSEETLESVLCFKTHGYAYAIGPRDVSGEDLGMGFEIVLPSTLGTRPSGDELSVALV